VEELYTLSFFRNVLSEPLEIGLIFCWGRMLKDPGISVKPDRSIRISRADLPGGRIRETALQGSIGSPAFPERIVFGKEIVW
jgi:hypothetical protein